MGRQMRKKVEQNMPDRGKEMSDDVEILRQGLLLPQDMKTVGASHDNRQGCLTMLL